DHAAALGGGPGLQGRFRTTAHIHPGHGADRAALPRRRCRSVPSTPCWLHKRNACGLCRLPVLVRTQALALGCVWRTRFFQPGSFAHPSAGAMHVPGANTATSAKPHAVLLRLAATVARTDAA